MKSSLSPDNHQPLAFCAVSGIQTLDLVVAEGPFVSRKPYAISNRIRGGAVQQGRIGVDVLHKRFDI